MASESQTSISLTSSVEFPAVAHAKSSHLLWMVSLKAPLYKAESRAPVDLVAVLDKSGSMGGEKMNLCKTTLDFIVEQLSPTDRLSIVEYDDNVDTALHLTRLDEFGKERAKNAIKNIQIGGSTNLCGGLCEGVHLLRSRRKESEYNEVSSVLLLTDGQANCWHTQLEPILSALRSGQRADRGGNRSFSMPSVPYSMRNTIQVQQVSNAMPQFSPGPSAPSGDENNNNNNNVEMDLPCSLNTFGYGSNHDSVLLKGIAEAGQGIYYFIKSNTDVPEAFADCLAGLLSVAAQRITLKIEAAPSVQISKLYTKFLYKEVSPGKVFEISLGDIQSEEARDLIFQVELPSISAPSEEFPVGTATLTYHNVLNSTMETITSTTIVARPVVCESMTRNYLIDKHFNRVMSAEAMTLANEAGNKGDYKEGQRILNEAIVRISESVSASDDFCKGLMKDLAQCRDNMTDRTTYTTTGMHMMSNNISSHTKQRMANVSYESQTAYTTGARSAMHSKKASYFSKQ